jgi:hypothetical protein
MTRATECDCCGNLVKLLDAISVEVLLPTKIEPDGDTTSESAWEFHLCRTYYSVSHQLSSVHSIGKSRPDGGVRGRAVGGVSRWSSTSKPAGSTRPATRFIQLAAMACELPDWHEVGTFEAKVQFDPALCEASALEKNSYSAGAWETAIPWPLAAINFSGFLREHATVARVSARTGRSYSVALGCAHNAEFDFGFVAEGFKRLNLFLPMAFGPLCTLALARWVTMQSRNPPRDHRLETLCDWLGIEHDQAHDALGDVRATTKLAAALSKHVIAGGLP